MSTNVKERPISAEEPLNTVEQLQGLPAIEGNPAHGQVEACDVTCSAAETCNGTIHTE